MMTRCTFGSSLLLLALLLAAPLPADAQGMPDPKEIAGLPLPVGDVPLGTVTVRVIRETLAGNIPDQLVELSVDGVVRQQKTNESGRAEFSGLRPGARVKAVTVVQDERLESREFPVPAAGGVRLLLVATDPASAAGAGEDRRPAALAPPGAIVLGEQSRFVFELGDEALNVFSILQIVNTASTPVDTPEPIVFEGAANGGTVTVLNGSSPRAKAEDRRVVVAGPFPPGPTLLQFGYSVPYSGPTAAIEQRMPLALNKVTILAQKVGDLNLSSPHIAERREMAAQGETYIIGQGPGVKAGEAVSFAFDRLPHSPVWPRNLALAIAAAILAGGAWSSLKTSRVAGAHVDRTVLEVRRDGLFSELTAMERRRRPGEAETPKHAARRKELLAELESVYAALDN
jgi:hypothetical protein